MMTTALNLAMNALSYNVNHPKPLLEVVKVSSLGIADVVESTLDSTLGSTLKEEPEQTQQEQIQIQEQMQEEQTQEKQEKEKEKHKTHNIMSVDNLISHSSNESINMDLPRKDSPDLDSRE